MSGAFQIRPTEETDIPAVSAIYADAVLTGTASYEFEPPSLDEMRRRFRDVTAKGFPHFVAVRDGMVQGYAYAGPYHHRRGYRFSVEDSIYISPTAQRGGIGRALLTEIIRLCTDAGYRQMIAVIGSGTENPASVGLHQGLGFRMIGVIEGSGFKHGKWVDTVLMQRALGPGRTTLPENPQA